VFTYLILKYLTFGCDAIGDFSVFDWNQHNLREA